MFVTKVVKYDSIEKSMIHKVRNTVFTDEQGIPSEIDFDGLDNAALHALIYIDKIVVGTGRMLNDGHIGRISILKEHRGLGLGAELVKALVESAKENSYDRVYLGAQKHAIKFYEKLGFETFGDEYVEAGIEHMSMEKTLV